VDGIVIINKPKHQTSHDIVRKAKKILNEKVGHTGTLDPNATGVLPLLIGKGTELSKYLINHDKTYEAILQLGEKRDTGDVEGKIIEQKNVTEKSLNTENINSVFKTLIGKQEQIPPIYSALKVNGKKLYEYARNGEEVKLPINEVDIYNLELISYEDNKIVFKCNCSKGTYIRSLIQTICEKLNVIGTMSDLIRTKQGNFDISNTYTIKDIENGNYKVLSVKDLFDYKIYNLNEDEYNKVKNGSHIKINSNEDKLLLYYNNEEVAIYKKKDEFYVCDIMLI
jgi:tRNA pseudouridine55 synthase